MSLVLRPMFQVSVLSVMNFSYQLSLYTSDVNLQVSLLRCIRHSVDGFEQVSSVDCSGIKGGNFQCLLDYVIRYRNKCFWCCDRCSRSQYRHADIQEIITIVGTNMFYFSMQTCLIGKMFSCYTLLLYREPSRL
ncbi:uncharacterized protein [Dysidea avara]|uniref:uncharacterized protein isoform X3 n=1 Tax=Dysidea avara TaxID=196820 RepID=UPI00332A372A